MRILKSIKKKTALCFVYFFLQLTFTLQAQNNVGIGTNTPDASAILELLSTNKGMLVPRMNTTAMTAIPNPANSLLVYNTDSMCYFFYRTPLLTWVSLCQNNSGSNSLPSSNDTIYANYANVDSIIAHYINTDTIYANYINVDSLFANYIHSDTIIAHYISSDTIIAHYLNADTIVANFIFADSIFAHYIQCDSIFANYASFDSLYINGTSIQQIISDSIAAKAWLLLGNSNTNSSVNFIGTTNAIDLVVKSNDTERMRVLSSGNIGIGTPTPATQLEIAGQIKITGGTPALNKVLTSDASGLATWQNAIPQGVIVLWSGLISNIPVGWALCDGNTGTPNLTDRFILSVSSSSENPGATGGASSFTLTVGQLPVHNHTFTSGSAGSHNHSFTTNSAGAHQHNFYWYPNAKGDCSGFSSVVTGGGSSCGTAQSPDPTEGIHTHTGTTNSDGNHSHTGTTDPTGSGTSIDNRPAYYKLAYIMKL